MTNVIVTGFGERCNLVREGNMFVKDEISNTVGELSEALCILASWFLSPTSKNSVLVSVLVFSLYSVLKKLRVIRLAVIQEEIC